MCSTSMKTSASSTGSPVVSIPSAWKFISSQGLMMVSYQVSAMAITYTSSSDQEAGSKM